MGAEVTEVSLGGLPTVSLRHHSRSNQRKPPFVGSMGRDTFRRKRTLQSFDGREFDLAATTQSRRLRLTQYSGAASIEPPFAQFAAIDAVLGSGCPDVYLLVGGGFAP